MGVTLLALLAGQLAATWILGRRRQAPASRHQLALACAGTIPVIGLLLATAALSIQGRNRPVAELAAAAQHRPGRRALGISAVPLLDRLTGAPAERRAALAGLTRAGDADAITTLRWLIARGSPDAVVEAAMAIDELARRREARAAELLAAADREPTYERLLAAGDAYGDLVLTGLADPTLVPRLAAEARALYRRAAELRPRPPAALVERWASLELAAARPAEALALLSHEREPADSQTAGRLLALRRDAVFAARDGAMA